MGSGGVVGSGVSVGVGVGVDVAVGVLVGVLEGVAVGVKVGVGVGGSALQTKPEPKHPVSAMSATNAAAMIAVAPPAMSAGLCLSALKSGASVTCHSSPFDSVRVRARAEGIVYYPPGFDHVHNVLNRFGPFGLEASPMIIRRLDRRKGKGIARRRAPGARIIVERMLHRPRPRSIRSDAGLPRATCRTRFYRHFGSDAFPHRPRDDPFPDERLGRQESRCPSSRGRSRGMAPLAVATSDAFSRRWREPFDGVAPEALVAAPCGPRRTVVPSVCPDAGEVERNAVWTLAMQLDAAMLRTSTGHPSTDLDARTHRHLALP